MLSKGNALWLVLAVSLGLFAYSLTAIFANGFNLHLLYPLLLGAINLAAFFVLRKSAKTTALKNTKTNQPIF